MRLANLKIRTKLFGLIGVSMSSATYVAISLALSMAALGMCEGVFWTTATDLGGRERV